MNRGGLERAQRLGGPNDPSPGQCYAPIENGSVNLKKKKHIEQGKDAPPGWVQVPCCHGKASSGCVAKR